MKTTEWTSNGSDAIHHIWAEENYPEELALAIANATPKVKITVEDSWTGNSYTNDYEEIVVSVKGKTFKLTRNYSRSHEGYWKPHTRWN